MKRLTAVLLAAVALFACRSNETEAKPAPAPALWKVADADTVIYLFGTIHLLPEGLDWQSPKIVEAMKASDMLVLETVIAKDPAATGATIAKLGMSPGLPPILERVPAERRPALQQAIARAGVPAASLNRMETWAAALMLASASFKDLKVSPAHGAEPVLTNVFQSAGKPVWGLETPEQQLGFFDALPENAQRTFLASVTEDGAAMQKEFDAMIAAWSAGDVRQIAVTFDDELRLSPELAEVLLRRRNRDWAARIAARMASPGTVFVAVGAGHLAGADSVNALLAARGLKVTRLQ